jgi:hypothetical protein
LVVVAAGVFGEKVIDVGEVASDRRGKAIEGKNRGEDPWATLLRRAGDSTPYQQKAKPDDSGQDCASGSLHFWNITAFLLFANRLQLARI